MKIYLIGMMGSGKTTVGKKLATKLNYPFYDLDNMIEQASGMSVSEYFAKFGEDKFRLIEQETLRKTFSFTKAVISTGGGTPCFFNNIDEINSQGISIYLQANTKLILSRLNGKESEKRPLMNSLNTIAQQENYIESLLLKRKYYYEQAKIQISALNININQIIQLLANY